MRSLAQFIDPTPTLSLESRMDRLALESNILANVIGAFKNVVPELREKLVNAFDSLKGADDLTKEVNEVIKSFKKVEKKIPHASYLNVAKVVVSVPEGFKGNMLDYLTFLNSISEEIFRDANKVLGEYNVVLSSFISNKQDKITLKDHTALFKRVKERRVQITEKIATFFPTTSVTSKQRLSDVCERFADLEPMSKVVELLGRERKSHNLKEISASVRQITDLLNIVVDDVQKNGIENVSGAAAMNISEGAYELGKFIELVAIYRTLVDQSITAAKDLFEKLDKIL